MRCAAAAARVERRGRAAAQLFVCCVLCVLRAYTNTSPIQAQPPHSLVCAFSRAHSLACSRFVSFLRFVSSFSKSKIRTKVSISFLFFSFLLNPFISLKDLLLSFVCSSYLCVAALAIDDLRFAHFFLKKNRVSLSFLFLFLLLFSFFLKNQIVYVCFGFVCRFFALTGDARILAPICVCCFFFFFFFFLYISFFITNCLLSLLNL